MGEAFTGVADDATAIYWNPAGLSLLKSKEFSAMHNFYFEEISHDFLGYAQPLGKDRAIGLGLVGLFITDFERYPENPASAEPEGTFSLYDIALSLSYSQRLFENLYGGMNLKGIHQEIDQYCGQGMAVDLGVLYKSKIKGLDLGCTIQNIGPEMKIYERGFPLPLIIRAGGSYRLLKNKLLLALDAKKPLDQEVSLHLGTEWWPFKVMVLRGGYRHKLDNIKNDPLIGLTAGAGFKYRWLHLDFSYVPYGNLGDTYRVSLLTRFGGQKADSRKQRTGGREEKGERPTSPLAVKVEDTGDYTRDKARLYVSWTKMPKAKEYQYAIGTNPGERDVIDWISAGIRTEVDITGLNLRDGEIYYISVRAKKKGLIFSKWLDLGSSDGIIVDSIPPTTPVVLDDGTYATSNKGFHTTWSSADQVSGIKEYLYALGTTPNGSDVISWRSAGTNTELPLTVLNLKDGVTYYSSVKAIDNAGNESMIASSDGIMVDPTPPTLTSIQDEGEYTTDSTRLSFAFDFEDKESGIEEYQYAIITERTNVHPGGVRGWKKITKTEIAETSLNLTNGQTYYLTVKAKNRAGLWSRPESSDGIMVDTTPPLVIQPPGDEGEYSKAIITLIFNWPPASDQESGIETYWLLIGTSPDRNDVFDGEVGSVLTKEIAECEQGKNYYARIKAKNKAGLWSVYSRSSDGIMVDTTPPSTPVVIDDGGKINFSSSDDESGVIEYQYAIGTGPAWTNILDWASSELSPSPSPNPSHQGRGNEWVVSPKGEDYRGDRVNSASW